MSQRIFERRWLSCREVGEMLNLNPGSVWRMVKRGAIPASRIGHTLRIDRQSLDALLKPIPVKKPAKAAQPTA